MKKIYKLPLGIQIFWDNNNIEGKQIAERVYHSFSHDIKNNLSLSIGIPVFFNNTFETIELSSNGVNFENQINILLVDEHMYERRIHWIPIIDYLIDICNDSTDNILIPIAMYNNVYNISSKLKNTQFHNYYEYSNESLKFHKIMLMLSYHIDLQLEKIINNNQSISKQLFISYARSDGTKHAENLIKSINENTAIHTFLDKNNIDPGQDFIIEITNNIAKSTLVVIQTDNYSSREMCCKELLVAKKMMRPIIVLNFIQEGEDRSFPYIGNLKTIRREKNINYFELITEILRESIKRSYKSLFTKYIIHYLGWSESNIKIISYPPELLSLVNLNSDDIIIYPDPPLGFDEIEILHQLKQNLSLFTPITYLLKFKFQDKILNNVKIGLSVSEPNFVFDKTDVIYRMQECLNYICTFILLLNGKLVFGGNINYSGKYNFLEILYDIVHRFIKNQYDNTEYRIQNYIWSKQDAKITSKHICDYSLIEFMECNEDLRDIPGKMMKIIKLTKIRSKMMKNNDICIFIGGKVTDFMGRYSGIFEEIYLALYYNKPMFVLGGFGGETKRLIDIIFFNKDDAGNSSVKFEVNDITTDEKEKYNTRVDYEERIDYSNHMNFVRMNKNKILNNGLSQEENYLLFTTQDLILINTLLVKGIYNIVINDKNID